jgi:hypothetical protein
MLDIPTTTDGSRAHGDSNASGPLPTSDGAWLIRKMNEFPSTEASQCRLGCDDLKEFFETDKRSQYDKRTKFDAMTEQEKEIFLPPSLEENGSLGVHSRRLLTNDGSMQDEIRPYLFATYKLKDKISRLRFVHGAAEPRADSPTVGYQTEIGTLVVSRLPILVKGRVCELMCYQADLKGTRDSEQETNDAAEEATRDPDATGPKIAQ